LPRVTRREIVSLALPAAASALLNNAFRVIDQWAAGGLGTDAQAAIGSCTFVLIALYGVHTVISAGAGPLIGRATGARDLPLLRRAYGNAITGALIAGLVVAIIGGLGAGPLVRLIGLEGDPAELATTLLAWLCLLGVPMALNPTLDAVFVGLGRTRAMMVLQVLAAVLNALLNPLLIFEMGLGVRGAALATVTARTMSAIVGLWLLQREIKPQIKNFWPDVSLLRMLRIGFPACWTTIAYAGVYWALLAVAISPLGPAVNAALGIGFSALEGMAWPMYLGVSLAVASVVSRRLGAGEPDEARRALRLATPLVTGLGAGVTLAFWLSARPICAVFTRDPDVLEEAVRYAWILGFSQVFVAWEALAEGVLGGAGDTRTIFRWSVPWNLLRVPLGWAIAIPLGFGPAGIWWVINATSVVKSLGKATAALRGVWVKTVV